MAERAYKYFAFISYKSEDLAEAWKLKKKLDRYKLPTILCKQYDKDRNPTYEAFLDKTNIQPGSLTQELQSKLDNSHYLIVVCSPRSAQSKYVAEEIEWFTRDGREEEMFLFIVDSDPDNIENSFNPAIKKIEGKWSKRTEKKHEILGVNIKEKDIDKMFFIFRWPIIGPWLQRERAYMQLISKLLNLDFEQLWSYQKIRLTEIFIAYIFGILVFIGALFYTWHINTPIDIVAYVQEKSVHNGNLPSFENAEVTFIFPNKTERDTIHSVNDSIVLKEIAHRNLNQLVRAKVTCKGFIDVDTTFYLTQRILLNVSRDPSVFGDIHFLLYNQEKEEFVSYTALEIDGRTIYSDKEGHVSLFIPLANQKKKYHIKASVPLEKDTICMPCGPNDVIVTK